MLILNQMYLYNILCILELFFAFKSKLDKVLLLQEIGV